MDLEPMLGTFNPFPHGSLAQTGMSSNISNESWFFGSLNLIKSPPSPRPWLFSDSSDALAAPHRWSARAALQWGHSRRWKHRWRRARRRRVGWTLDRCHEKSGDSSKRPFHCSAILYVFKIVTGMDGIEIYIDLFIVRIRNHLTTFKKIIVFVLVIHPFECTVDCVGILPVTNHNVRLSRLSMLSYAVCTNIVAFLDVFFNQVSSKTLKPRRKIPCPMSRVFCFHVSRCFQPIVLDCAEALYWDLLCASSNGATGWLYKDLSKKWGLPISSINCCMKWPRQPVSQCSVLSQLVGLSLSNSHHEDSLKISLAEPLLTS